MSITALVTDATLFLSDHSINLLKSRVFLNASFNPGILYFAEGCGEKNFMRMRAGIAVRGNLFRESA